MEKLTVQKADGKKYETPFTDFGEKKDAKGRVVKGLFQLATPQVGIVEGDILIIKEESYTVESIERHGPRRTFYYTIRQWDPRVKDEKE